MTAQDLATDPDDRLKRLLGGADLAPLRLRLRRYIERRIDGATGQSLLLTQLSATEHEALALLTGRPAGPARSVRIDVARLDADLRAAGIDDAARAHCMGLIREFDLDFVITSEREWACYAELPGVAIAQLQRREGIDAVHVSRWTWDGRARRREHDPDRRFPAP